MHSMYETEGSFSGNIEASQKQIEKVVFCAQYIF